MTAHVHPPEKRAAALETYKAEGLAAAHREHDVPKSTLRKWAQAEGLNPAELAGAAVLQTEAAVAARNARMEEHRAELRENLLLGALDMTERFSEPHVDYRGRDHVEVSFEQAPADACRNYATAAAILIDKYRLEMGESTSHQLVDHGSLGSQVDRVTKLQDELRERRDRKAG